MDILTQSQGIADRHTSIAVHNVERAIRAIKTFTPHAQGIVPQSGGGTVNFLRADGTWAAPLGVDSGSVSGITNRLPKFTGPTSLGNSSIQDDGTAVSTPELIIANGGFASHAASTIDASAATIPLSITDTHTNQTSSIVELSIDSTGSSFAGATGGGGGVPPNFSGSLPGGASSTMLAANAVGTIVSGSLTNIALFANAQHGTTNYALFAPHGDLSLGAGNTTLGGTLTVNGNTSLVGTCNVSQLLTTNGGIVSNNGPVTLNPSNGGVSITTTFGSPSPPSVEPAAILIQEADQAAANDASLVWWTIGNTPGTYNVYAGAKNTASSPSFLNPKFVVGIQNSGTTGITNVTERFAVTNAGVVVSGTADMGSNKILNLANGSAAQDGAAFGQIGSAVNAAVSGTTNKLAKFTGANVVGNGWASDDGTTWGVSGKFAVDEASGRTGIGTAPDTNDNLAVQATFRVKDASSLLRLATDGAGNNYVESGAAFVSDSKAVLKFTSMLGATVFGQFETSGQLTLNDSVAVASASAGASVVKFLGHDVLTNTDNTNGPAFKLAINAIGRRDVYLYDTGGTGNALDFGVGSSQGTYIQAVDTGWNTAQALGIQQFGGATTIGNGTNNCGVSGTFSCTGLVDLTGQSVYLGRQILTSTTGTVPYTPTTGTRKILLRMVGGGGGGGGGAGGTSTAAVGAGGMGGAYVEKWINPGALITTTGNYTAGAGGTAGANTGGAGGTGGDTTITIQGTPYTAKGGIGGSGMAAGSAAAIVDTGGYSAASTAADFNSQDPGFPGVRVSTALYWGGKGGGSPFGQGGKGGFGAGGVAGSNATGYGSGGGGANVSTPGATGGTGAQGVIVIDEWR